MFNIVKNRELLVARLKREATYLMADVATSRRQKIQPFVVVCRKRTGSNMLRYALETHPQVVQYGEIFRDKLEKIWGAHGKYACRPRTLIEWRRSDARSFLNDVIFRDTAAPVRAVGFKLFYWHGRSPGSGNPWPVLRERADVKIIHLVRTNPIAAFISTERTLQDEPYVEMRGKPAKAASSNDEPITVDIGRFREFMLEYEQYVRTLHEELGQRNTMELSYEELSSKTDETINSVLDFLGADRRPLRPQTVRQSKGNLMKRITNLDEVAAAHRGTRWESAPDRW